MDGFDCRREIEDSISEIKNRLMENFQTEVPRFREEGKRWK